MKMDFNKKEAAKLALCFIPTACTGFTIGYSTGMIAKLAWAAGQKKSGFVVLLTGQVAGRIVSRKVWDACEEMADDWFGTDKPNDIFSFDMDEDKDETESTEEKVV